MPNINVKKITDTAFIDRITDWMYSWWGKDEGYSREAVRVSMEHSLRENGLPQTFGLFSDGELIGMYQFTYSDLFVRPDIYPWLANVYVDPRFRGRGYGRMLLSAVPESALAAGIGELYLFTEIKGLYEKLGWRFMGELDSFLNPRMRRLYKLELKSRTIKA